MKINFVSYKYSYSTRTPKCFNYDTLWHVWVLIIARWPQGGNYKVGRKVFRRSVSFVVIYQHSRFIASRESPPICVILLRPSSLLSLPSVQRSPGQYPVKQESLQTRDQASHIELHRHNPTIFPPQQSSDKQNRGFCRSAFRQVQDVMLVEIYMSILPQRMTDPMKR